ncbi:MAG: hypothetical protein JSU59_03020, partial [Nitrospirota bacterium]
NEKRATLKVLSIHGIGPHKSGHSTRLAENLARSLQMNVRAEQYKEFSLAQTYLFPNETVGTLRISRYFNDTETREMIFYELTWAEILTKYKELLEFDTSGEHAFRRAEVNKVLKEFSNAHLADPVIYLGEPQERINVSVAQSICWMLSSDWDGLPTSGSHGCFPDLPGYLNYFQDEYVFMSHSLGSRVLLDSLQRIARLGALLADPSLTTEDVGIGIEESVRQEMVRRLEGFKDKEFSIYMLSNQLLLMQLGRPKPPVTGQHDQYCLPDSPLADQRFMAKLHMVAFCDPNDLLSYAVPPNFVEEYMDSRMCTTMDNVSINVAQVKDLFGLGRIANPMTAHTEYDNDERILALITRGVGTEIMAPIVKERCEWVETR